MTRTARCVLLLLCGLLLAGCGLNRDGTWKVDPVGAAAGAVTGNAAFINGGGSNATFDAGNIISDEVFYNAAAMDAPKVQSFLDAQGCAGACLANTRYTWPGGQVAWCKPVPAGSGSFAVMLSVVSAACGINPQVSLTIIQKESQGLTRPPPAALTGFGCPDTGAGGSANCDSGAAGVWAQTWGMVQAFAHLKADPSRINYPVGKTSQILWNVAETGCGSGPVTVANTATATLYTYTPYQPNPAALAAYPGTGDRCSAYGNRNFFRMFQKNFGGTGGGVSTGGVGAGGVDVTLPSNGFVAAAARGQVIHAPTQGVARGIATGLKALGVLYVFGGGFGPGGGPTDGCARAGGALNSCKGLLGWDCSGLSNYVLVSGGYPSPGGSSGEQQNPAHAVPWASGQPGDLIGFPGHVAIFLGIIGGVQYILEASDVGIPIHVVPLTRTDHGSSMYRYWVPAGQAQV